MNNFMLMEPTNQTFQDLIGSGVKYTVPRFQRDYAWTREQWEDLWADIETLEDEHYYREQSSYVKKLIILLNRSRELKRMMKK